MCRLACTECTLPYSRLLLLCSQLPEVVCLHTPSKSSHSSKLWSCPPPQDAPVRNSGGALLAEICTTAHRLNVGKKLRGHDLETWTSRCRLLEHAPSAERPGSDNLYGCFYNNFEVARVAAFRRPDVADFTARVAASGMVYKKRWGDAPLR